MELADDVITGYLVGSRRERDDWNLGETFLQYGQLGIFGAEIVAPLRDAVSFVDSNQRDVQVGQEPSHLRLDPLGRDIQELEFVLPGKLLDLLLLGLGHKAVESCSRDTAGPQALDLVLHQGDERRYNQGNTRGVDSRELVTYRLTPSRRHKHQGIFLLEKMLDNI